MPRVFSQFKGNMSIMKTVMMPRGVELLAPVSGDRASLLTPEALNFFARLHREFNSRRLELLRQRKQRQDTINRGARPGFLPETRSIREGDWQVLPAPEDLQRRWVEITGPVDRKMVINALNSGADCYMADFEDSLSPSWEALIDGQINLRDAVRGTIEFTSPEGKQYRLNQHVAT